MRGVAGAVVVGMIILVIGAIVAPARFAGAYLVAYTAVVSTVVGALLLIMIQQLSGANWFVVLRRQTEDIVAALPVLAVLMIPVLVAMPVLYPWVGAADSPAMAAVLRQKGAYLNVPFFVLRAVLYWASWIVVGELLRRASIAQDRGVPGATARLRTVSTAGVVVVSLTMTFAAFDWMMSLTPEWSSSIYGVYWFAGGIVAALALVVVLCRALQRAHPGRGMPITPEHFHASGKLLLTFILFWAYIAFSQLLIIWLGNLPREVPWYVARFESGWGWLGIIVGIGHLVIPFLALLLRAVKRRPALVAGLGVWLLAMHYLDTYWIVLPDAGRIGWGDVLLDAAALAAVGGLALLCGAWRSRGLAPVPVGDPVIDVSRAYHSPLP